MNGDHGDRAGGEFVVGFAAAEIVEQVPSVLELAEASAERRIFAELANDLGFGDGIELAVEIGDDLFVHRGGFG
jgi:hypothetical protein